MGSGGEATDRAAAILTHPVRRKIIRTLGERGPLQWKELSEAIGTSTGALYHHLDVLEKIVARRKDKRYELTSMGREVFEYVKRNESPYVPDGVAKLFGRRSPRSALLDAYVPRALFLRMTASRIRALVVGLALLALVSGVSYLSRTGVVFMTVAPASSGTIALVVTLLSSGAAFAALVGASWALGSRATPVASFLAVALASLPLVAFTSLVWVAFQLGVAPWPGGAAGLTLTLVAFQTWAVGLLAAGLGVATGMRVEKALTIGVVVLYASTLAMFLLGVRLA